MSNVITLSPSIAVELDHNASAWTAKCWGLLSRDRYYELQQFILNSTAQYGNGTKKVLLYEGYTYHPIPILLHSIMIYDAPVKAYIFALLILFADLDDPLAHLYQKLFSPEEQSYEMSTNIRIALDGEIAFYEGGLHPEMTEILLLFKRIVESEGPRTSVSSHIRPGSAQQEHKKN